MHDNQCERRPSAANHVTLARAVPSRRQSIAEKKDSSTDIDRRSAPAIEPSRLPTVNRLLEQMPPPQPPLLQLIKTSAILRH